MKILRYIGNISQMGKTTRDKQRSINVSEVYHLWNHLVQRYNVIYATNILLSSVKDDDLRLVLESGSKVLSNHVTLLENEMIKYGIPLPIRPPKQTQTTKHLEVVTDRYILRRILRGIQGFLPTHTMAFMHSTSPKIRDMFMSFLFEEMKLYDKLIEYGKIKGYEIAPPVYRA